MKEKRVITLIFLINMAKVFLDTNAFIDLVERNKKTLDDLQGHQLCISSLSVHILLYVTKQKIPNKIMSELFKFFTIITFNKNIVYKSLEGPTNDFEDNVQLHSAAEADCNIFLTNDKKIKDLKFFGKVKINSN